MSSKTRPIAPVNHANGEHTGDWRELDTHGNPVEPIPTGMQLGAVLEDPEQLAAARLMLEKREAPADDPEKPLHWEHALAIVRMRAQRDAG